MSLDVYQDLRVPSLPLLYKLEPIPLNIIMVGLKFQGVVVLNSSQLFSGVCLIISSVDNLEIFFSSRMVQQVLKIDIMVGQTPLLLSLTFPNIPQQCSQVVYILQMTHILFPGRTDPAPKIFANEGNPTPIINVFYCIFRSL